MNRVKILMVLGVFALAHHPALSQETDPPLIHKVGGNQIINCLSDHSRIGVWVENWKEGFTYSWNTGSTDSTITVKPNVSSTYTVSIVNEELGIQTIRSFDITVKNDPIEVKGINQLVDKFTCPGSEIELSVEAMGGHGEFSYRWDFGSNSDAPLVSPLSDQSYQVTVTDACETQAIAEVSVQFEEHDPIEVSTKTEFTFDCSDEAIKIWPRLNNTEGGVGYGYHYTFSEWNESNQSIEVAAKDGAVFTARVSDACEMDEVETQIRLVQNEIELPTTTPVSVCANEEVSILEGETGLYYWDGETMNTNFSIVASESQVFHLTYIDKCGDAHLIDKIVAIEDVESNFDFSMNVVDGTVKLTPEVTANQSTYEWYLNGAIVSVEEQPELPLAAASENTIELNVSNKNGCSNKTTRTVVMQDGMDIPSAFSPNGDGVNDYFSVTFEEELSSFYVQIFDRWGQLLYQSRDQYFGWDGSSKMGTEPLATYAYVIKATTVAGHKFEKTGTITVLTSK